MDAMRQEMIFNSQERSSMEGHAYLRSYSAITRDQLTGLLAALGEYAIRVGQECIPQDLSDRELIEAHRILVGFYWQAHGSVDSRTPPWYMRESRRLSSIGECVFDSRERDTLSLHKYIRGHEGLTKEELLCLLAALGRYSRDAPMMKVLPHVLAGVTRTIHAHNALIAFIDRPFTLDEFSESVRAVLRGEASQLTRPMQPTDFAGG